LIKVSRWYFVPFAAFVKLSFFVLVILWLQRETYPVLCDPPPRHTDQKEKKIFLI
jgi:hypothetical protein